MVDRAGGGGGGRACRGWGVGGGRARISFGFGFCFCFGSGSGCGRVLRNESGNGSMRRCGSGGGLLIAIENEVLIVRGN